MSETKLNVDQIPELICRDCDISFKHKDTISAYIQIARDAAIDEALNIIGDMGPDDDRNDAYERVRALKGRK